MSKPNYRFTPSLLGSFQGLLDSDLLWDAFYGSSDEPVMSPEEFGQKQEQELLNAINRVPFVSEPASRGTALNEILDCLIERRKPKEGISLSALNNGLNEMIGIRASLDGFTFDFGIELINELLAIFRGAICQHRCEATIDTSRGPVVLYGDADYILRDVVSDLKTTTKYSYGKFEKGWQKDLYPYALIESGEVMQVSGFEYVIAKLSGGTARSPLITGEISREWYDYSHEAATARLRAISEQFIDWIELHREQILLPRIFNQ